MQPKLAEIWCLFQAEVLQEITESAGKAIKEKWKTVNEAPAEDKAEEAAPDALG